MKHENFLTLSSTLKGTPWHSSQKDTVLSEFFYSAFIKFPCIFYSMQNLSLSLGQTPQGENVALN